jgi:hypothetical protein
VGWRDRDWAKFTDDEWSALYGVRRRDRAPEGGDVVLPGYDRVRLAVWCAVAASVLGVAILAYSGRPSGANGGSSARADPVVLYGVADSARQGVGPGGLRMVCTEEALEPAAGGWTCLAETDNVNNVPVIAPHPYDGQCKHVVADQSRGVWLCLNAEAPRRIVPPAPS